MRPSALRKGASKEEKIARFTMEEPIIQSIIFQESAGNESAKSGAGAAGLNAVDAGYRKRGRC